MQVVVVVVVVVGAEVLGRLPARAVLVLTVRLRLTGRRRRLIVVARLGRRGVRCSSNAAPSTVAKLG